MKRIIENPPEEATEYCGLPEYMARQLGELLFLVEPQSDDWAVYETKYEVCGCCQGRGSMVNPSIDGNGLSAEDFAEDPDFAEDYFAGSYDITCPECDGARVVLVPATEEGQARLQKLCEIQAGFRAEVAAERRMGA